MNKVYIYILLALVLSLSIINIAYAAVAVFPCNTSEDCTARLYCPHVNPPCSCTIPCINGQCAHMAVFSSSLNDSYFINAAEKYIISKVGKEFYNHHYIFYKVSRYPYEKDNVRVYFNLSLEGYALPARGVIFDCMGNVTGSTLYLNNSSNVVNKSKALEIANAFLIQNNITPPKDYTIRLDYSYGTHLSWYVIYKHPRYVIEIDYNTGKIVEESVSSSKLRQSTLSRMITTFSIFMGGIILTYLLVLRKLNRRDKLIGISLIASLLWYMLSYDFIAPLVFKITLNDPNVVLASPQPLIIKFLTTYLPLSILFLSLAALVYYHRHDSPPSKLWYVVPITTLFFLLADIGKDSLGLPSLTMELLERITPAGCFAIEGTLIPSFLIWIVTTVSFAIAYHFRGYNKFARNTLLIGVIISFIAMLLSITESPLVLINSLLLIPSLAIALLNKWFFKRNRITLLLYAITLSMTIISLILLIP